MGGDDSHGARGAEGFVNSCGVGEGIFGCLLDELASGIIWDESL